MVLFRGWKAPARRSRGRRSVPRRGLNGGRHARAAARPRSRQAEGQGNLGDLPGPEVTGYPLGAARRAPRTGRPPGVLPPARHPPARRPGPLPEGLHRRQRRRPHPREEGRRRTAPRGRAVAYTAAERPREQLWEDPRGAPASRPPEGRRQSRDEEGRVDRTLCGEQRSPPRGRSRCSRGRDSDGCGQRSTPIGAPTAPPTQLWRSRAIDEAGDRRGRRRARSRARSARRSTRSRQR
jgi:hypothetical protein